MASLRERRLAAVASAFPIGSQSVGGLETVKQRIVSERILGRLTRTELVILIEVYEARKRSLEAGESGATFHNNLTDAQRTFWFDWSCLWRQELRVYETGEESHELEARKAERERREGQRAERTARPDEQEHAPEQPQPEEEESPVAEYRQVKHGRVKREVFKQQLEDRGIYYE